MTLTLGDQVRHAGHMRRWGVVAGVLLPAVLLAGCSGDDDRPDAGVATPTVFEECNPEPRTHGDGMAIGLALHWKDGDHSYDEGAAVFVCVYPQRGGEASLIVPDGVTVSPTTRHLDPSGSGVLRFTVRVTPGASGQIYGRTESEGGGGSELGPQVVTEDDHWSFAEPQASG